MKLTVDGTTKHRGIQIFPWRADFKNPNFSSVPFFGQDYRIQEQWDVFAKSKKGQYFMSLWATKKK